MKRLCQQTLARLPAHIKQPSYDRHSLSTGIVHLGIGAFHRAHMASYVEACLSDDPSWGICGVSLRSAATREALRPQDGLYTMAVRQDNDTALQIMGAVRDILVAPQEPERLAAVLASPATRIVSLTVTEKGYCHDPATRALDLSHPDIVHDLNTSGYPRSAIGWLAHGVLARKAASVAPYTMLSCDNLSSNGALLRAVLLEYIGHKAPDSLAWASDALACPSTMVDRIVPATTGEDRAAIARQTDLEDAWPVVTEPFSQFVVEDHFPLGRPDWDTHGVMMVEDAEPFETMKLRMLNGSHSTLAYLGYLAGYKTVAEAMADRAFTIFVSDMMEREIIPTLTMPDGVDLLAYRDALLERFSNTGLRHRTYQIAMDGSQKLPQRLLATIWQGLEAGQSIERLALGVAGWLRYAMGRDEAGDTIRVQDPLADELTLRFSMFDGSATSLVESVLSLEAVFGADLRKDKRFQNAVTQSLESLLNQGAKAAVTALTRSYTSL